jgi:para-aminobenzoate synthetase component 1
MDAAVYYKCLPFDGDISSLAAAFCRRDGFVLLESGQFDAGRGRYSFLVWDPFDVVRFSGPDALARARARFRSFPPLKGGAPTPLPAGAAGYISYDYGLYKEAVALKPADEACGPDVYFGFYDRVVTVDHSRREIILSSTGLPAADPAERHVRALERLRELEDALSPFLAGADAADFSLACSADGSFEFPCDFGREQYLRAAGRALEYIAAGDLYQINLSRRFYCDLPAAPRDPFLLYRLLRRSSPGPFGCYLDAGDHRIISHSPERFLRLRGRRLDTRPMKGTRPRGADPERDGQLLQGLIESPKEKAELLMITDLLRNDLGRVCGYGSVRVREARTIETYANVHQATSSVEGELRPEFDAWDALEACLPGGSITGCPKIRSMRIIDELEPSRRGIYTGTLGYVSFTGDMDFNILIRTMLLKDRRVYFQAGGGIVADSAPEEEYEEIMVKAAAMASSLRRYAGMLRAGVKL